MGLLRLLLRLLSPPRRRRRYSSCPKNSANDAIMARRLAQHTAVRHVHEESEPRIYKGRCWVIDGDTIVINRTHIRLAGIDAPELDHRYGQTAKRVLARFCKGRIVTATCDGSSSYERVVAACHLEDGTDLSAEMVKAGYALDWRKYSGGKYRHLEPEGVRQKLWRADARQKGRMPPPTGTGGDIPY